MIDYAEEGIYLKDISYWADCEYIHYSEEYATYLRNMLEGSACNAYNESLESSTFELWPRYLSGSITADVMVAALDEAFQRSIEG